VTFFFLVIALWAVFHLYVGRRLWGPDPRYQWALGLTLVFSFATAPMTFMVMSRSGTWWADGLQWVGFVAMGGFSILWAATLLRDIGWLLTLALDRFANVLPEDPGRRELLRRGLDAGVLGVSAVLTTASVVRARMSAKVEHLELPIENLPNDLDGFRIAQVSDIHAGLVATHGAAFCTGNHEYYSGAGPWCEHIASLGIRVLTNDSVVLQHGDATMLLAGVPDRQGGQFLPAHAPDPQAVADAADPADFRLLLSHQPITAVEGEAAGFDLQLSGHTHAGQYMPFTLLIRLGQRWVEGLHRVGRMWLYVNRGTTWWGPPLRLGAPQEVTLITLRRA
jgi:uncharacterized protein